MRLVSIIVPCYNVEKYVRRCIDSIFNQTIDFDNIELILVDDSSADRTLEILHEYEQLYSDNIIVIECEKNGRQGTARNIGLQYATGKYIGFVDSDEWIEPDMYEHMYLVAEEHSVDVVFCRHTRDKEYVLNNSLRTEKKDSLIWINTLDERKKFMVSDIIGVGVWDKLYKRELIFDNNIVFPEGVAYKDILFGAMIYLYAEKIYILEENLYHYFVNMQSTVLTMNQLHGDDLEKVNLMKLEEYKYRGFYDEYYDEIEFDMLCTYYLAMFKLLCLRFDEFQCDKFNDIKRKITYLFPNICSNKYIKYKLRDVNKLSVSLLESNISESDLREFAKLYRKIAEQ